MKGLKKTKEKQKKGLKRSKKQKKDFTLPAPRAQH